MLYMPSSSLFAQVQLEVVNAFPVVEIDTTGIGTDSLALSILASDSLSSSNLPTQSFNVKTYITVSDITNIQNVHIRLGRSANSSDVVNLSFPYNYSSIPTGVVAIQKSANMIVVDFGQHINVYTLYLDVWIEDSLGNLSNTYTQQIN